jgi:dTDP-4-amino-4,6-dideoxygalactose transaminase
MRVPFLDLARIHAPLRERLLARLAAVLDSQRFILGPAVEDFEAALAARLGVGHAIGVSSGTDALLAALMALDVGPGDEVVLPAFTFFATAGVVARLGAVPVFADIEARSFNLAPAAALTRVTARTKAILPVHLFGRVADLEPLRAAGVPIVEDAAQAIGARDATGRGAGGLGAVGCLSFFPSKNLGALGDGGAVLTNDPTLAARVRRLRVHGAETKYVHHEVGGNFRLDALQAAALHEKLAVLAEHDAARQRNAQRYAELFAQTGLVGRGVIVLPEAGPGRSVWHQYVIRADRRDALQAALREAGVGTMVYYPLALHLQPCFAALGGARGDLPESERATAEALALPIYAGLTEAEQEYVVAQVAAFFR